MWTGAVNKTVGAFAKHLCSLSDPYSMYPNANITTIFKCDLGFGIYLTVCP